MKEQLAIVTRVPARANACRRAFGLGLGLVGLFGWLLVSAPVHADASLQLNPLKYEDTVTGSSVKSGFVDVSNPSDVTVQVQSQVQGFKQTDLDGNLAFYTDEALAKSIVPSLQNFSLGPRESIRVTFSVNPALLPAGGVYAALFFSTVPATVDAGTSYVSDAARVGTLLLLTHGGQAPVSGRVDAIQLPPFQFGRGLEGRVTFRNTAGAGGQAVTPTLTARVAWGRRERIPGAFVMPGAARETSFQRTGSFIGLIPVTVTDAMTGTHQQRWTLACTGVFRLIVPAALGLLIVLFWQGRRVGLARIFSRKH